MTFHTASVTQESPISMFGLLDLKAIHYLLVKIFYFSFNNFEAQNLRLVGLAIKLRIL